MFTARHRLDTLRVPCLLVSALFAGYVILGLLTGWTQGQEIPRALPAALEHTAAPIRTQSAAPNVPLQQALAALEKADWQRAIDAWRQVGSLGQHAAWRQLALGVAHWNAGQLTAAEAALAEAKLQDPENAVAYYLSGLWRLEQAEDAPDYADAVNPYAIRFASHGHADGLPLHSKTKSRLELEAINELELAIDKASRIHPHEPLVPIRWVMTTPYPMRQPAIPPTIGDLLNALNADNFKGKAHGLLVYLYLDHDRPEEAEYHVVHAGSHGIRVPYGYRLVGELYEQQGRSTDAYRTRLKAMHGEGKLATPAGMDLQDLLHPPNS